MGTGYRGMGTGYRGRGYPWVSLAGGTLADCLPG